MPFEEPGDVGQILLAFTGPAAGVARRPDFAAKDILDTGHRQPVTEDFADLGSRGEILVSGIDLELNSQVRIGSGQVHRMLEAFDPVGLAGAFAGSFPGAGNTLGASGNTPSRPGKTPGMSGNMPGASGKTPGRAGETPGGTGEASRGVGSLGGGRIFVYKEASVGFPSQGDA
ncbi:MAG: hypothetical protein WAM82_19135 [Thermoanaerobaculia bacterium]